LNDISYINLKNCSIITKICRCISCYDSLVISGHHEELKKYGDSKKFYRCRINFDSSCAKNLSSTWKTYWYKKFKL